MENTMNNRNEIPQQVKQVVSIAETLLQGQILGMYLYGSATMNKLRPDVGIYTRRQRPIGIAGCKCGDFFPGT